MAGRRGASRDEASKKVNPKAAEAARKPPATDVADMHTNSDLDASPDAQHHSIGTGPNQAASGAHTHSNQDGASLALWTGVTLTDPTGASTTAQLAAAIADLNALIRQKSA